MLERLGCEEGGRGSEWSGNQVGLNIRSFTPSILWVPEKPQARQEKGARRKETTTRVKVEGKHIDALGGLGYRILFLALSLAVIVSHSACRRPNHLSRLTPNPTSLSRASSSIATPPSFFEACQRIPRTGSVETYPRRRRLGARPENGKRTCGASSACCNALLAGCRSTNPSPSPVANHSARAAYRSRTSGRTSHGLVLQRDNGEFAAPTSSVAESMHRKTTA